MLNQVGQAATQGLQGLLNGTNQGARQTANASRPLGGIGDALQNLGAAINNSTARNTTGTAPGRRPAPAAAAGEQPSGPLLADTSEITSNATGGLGQLLNNLTTGLTNAAAGAQPQQQQQQQKKEPEIKPPPGVKSSAGAAAVPWLAAAVLLVQLLV